MAKAKAKSLGSVVTAALDAAKKASFATRTRGPGGAGQTEEIGAWTPVALAGCEGLELRVFSHWPLRPPPTMMYPQRSFQIRMGGAKPCMTERVSDLGYVATEIAAALSVVNGFAARAA
jgi:hypothetical protein